MQRYRCLTCSAQCQSARRPVRRRAQLRKRYVWQRQTLWQLAEAANRSVPWVRKQLDASSPAGRAHAPELIVIIADTTFWGRGYGLTVFRSPARKQNLWWQEVEHERMATYALGRREIEARGWTIAAAVVDGRRGFTGVFGDIPLQMCHFHQMKRVTTYLTRRPKTEAGRALREVMLMLPASDERSFTHALGSWYGTWSGFIAERTYHDDGVHWHYTHRNVRSAYLSMKRNLQYLFTYERYPDLAIPTTTNSLDGMFTQLKNRLAVHRRLRRDRRYRMIGDILAGGDDS